jgi:hypothetical protein
VLVLVLLLLLLLLLVLVPVLVLEIAASDRARADPNRAYGFSKPVYHATSASPKKSQINPPKAR